jgi:5-methylcytosine-specific restriction endonuclease McrA
VDVGMIDLSEKLNAQDVLFTLLNTKEKTQVYLGLDNTFVRYKTGSKRYQVFRKSLSCASPNCSREISYAKLQCHHTDAGKGIGHWNFFSADDVLMTKDHIIPLSKGGKDYLGNLQTMCKFCNSAKDNS